MRTLITGVNARAEEQLRDAYSIELIDQKIREAGKNLKAAKLSLAGLIQRRKSEEQQVNTLRACIDDLMVRAQEALGAGRDDLAEGAAQAIADMENEVMVRDQTNASLERRILQLRQSVETANRRIIDLKQGAIAARAVKREQSLQKKLGRHLSGESPIEEAETLIGDVMNRDDPFEQGEILGEIDRSLDHTDMAERMADAGFGDSSRVRAADVLSRLKNKI
ncbi:PspA/IM30 family protein [Ruegeria discodermiae]|uniref:PspA/IM30 family protein n=1 Tax=Ruegeria discodermiae TaxID=3064389 RepID=UPI002741419B|nr:PspA/IM30 family protein [Ruegeria sp. 2205SS24-7]